MISIKEVVQLHFIFATSSVQKKIQSNDNDGDFFPLLFPLFSPSSTLDLLIQFLRMVTRSSGGLI